MNTENFKQGFIKASIAKGFSKEESLNMYLNEINKYADENDNYQEVKDLLQEKGFTPNYGIDDTNPYAQQYNQELLKLRDDTHGQNPDLEALKAGLVHGTKGSLMGLAGGHLAGTIGKGLINPHYNFGKSLPGWGRAIGTAIGALAQGLPAAAKKRQEVEAAKSLTDPRITKRMLDMLSAERQLSNNQIGNYRPLPV